MSAAFSGALSHKRKHEAVEIAEALGIPNPEGKLSELRDQIQAHLDGNHTTLSIDPRFKGLYVRKRAIGSVSPDGDAKSAVTDTAKKVRKSTSKILDKTIDAASQSLPESPSSLRQVAKRVDANVQNALVPAEDLQKDLQVRAQKVTSALQKFTSERQVYIEKSISTLQKFLSKPEHLITTSIAVELLLIFRNLLQFYDHTLFFPPVGGAKGDFYSLLNTLFGWAPRTTLNLRYPEFRSLFHGEVWTAISWWFFFTILPPLALSTIVSFQPQKGFYAKTSGNAKQQVSRPPVHKADPFAYALFRLAILLFPLTTAAPAHIVDALGLSGDAQGRALGAGLLAALIGSERLGAHA